MSSIDERVVRLTLDNAQFERAAAATLKSLEALNKGLKLEGATKGLADVASASKNISLSHLETGVQNISDRFRAMSVIAITALSTIAHQAISTGTSLIRSLTVDPIKTGLQEYETNLNSIQTILANTGREGKQGLAEVTAALQELNEYSDQTIYNFSEMAKNIGTFTAAGVKLEVATQAIKGIANLAAISGSNSQQAASAMYQLSQALAAGKVSLMDWNSVVNAGMGGKVFQDSLMETARVHGVAIDKMVEDAGSFRLTLEKGWLTSEILTETLAKFTGDLTRDQLLTMGYTEQQIEGILKMGRTAKAAATEVKTASQLISTLREAAGSGWARTWELIFGDFDEAKKLWTGVNNIVGEFIKGSADARNKVIGDWKEMGGRTVLIEAIGNAFNALLAVAKPIRDAFRDIFPAVTGEQLYKITVAIRDFTAGLKISSTTADNLKRTFAGVFALLSLGWDIVREGVSFLLRLFGVVTEGSGGILEFTGNLGDFIVGLRNAIKQGKGIENFFEGLTKFIEPPIRLLKSIATTISSLFDGFDGVGAAKGLTSFFNKVALAEGLGSRIQAIWEGVFNILDNVFKKFSGTAGGITEFFDGLTEKVATSLQGINLQGIVAALGGGAIAALILSLRGLVNNVSDIFDGITDSLGAMQNTLRAATLLQIALAIGVLTASVAVLSKIDTAGLTRSLSAITVMFTQLLAAMLIFEKLSGFKGFAKMPFVAASMILLGGAIVVLAVAVKMLADLQWEELGRGLAGVTGLLAAVIATVKLMPPSSGLFTTALGLIALGAAIHILVGAVTDLAAFSWEELAKGLVGVGALLGALVLFTKFADASKGGVLQSAGIILLAVGIKILASAVKDFAKMDWAEIGRGLTVLAGALTVVTAALMLIPPTAPLAAAGVLVVAISLGLVGKALEQMAGMSWGEIGKGLTAMLGALTIIAAALYVIPPTAVLGAAGVLVVALSLGLIGEALEKFAKMSWEEIGKAGTVLAGALLIIAVAVNAMTGAVTGAAAVIIVAAALAILAPILLVFSQMSWEEIAKGLTMLAGVFVVLGLAGLVLTPLVPTLLALGVAITLLGIGVLAAGAGVFLFSAALTALAIAGAAGTAALVAMVGALAGLIPEVLKQLGLGIVAFAQVIATAGPAFTAAIVAVLMALIDAINKLAPKIIETLYNLLEKLLVTIQKHAPKMIDAGLKILIAFLDGIANNIERVVTSATNVIVNFIAGIQRNLPRIIQAGVDLIIAYVNGLASAIRNSSGAMGEAGANLASAIIEGMARGLTAGLAKITAKARDIARSALNAAKSALGIASPSKEFLKIGEQSNEGFALGLERFAGLVNKAAEGVGAGAIDSLKDSLSGLSTAVSGDIDIQPTITPVLDLSDVKKNAGRIGQMIEVKPVSVRAAYSSARNISGVYQQNNQTARDDDPTTPDTNPAPITFIQNNNSPKALSTADIYRQTKNQLSVAKGALDN